MRVAQWFSLVLVGALAALTVTPAFGRTPAPTATVEAVKLEAPRDLVVQANTARWSDQSVGEDGYRVVAAIGSETRTFELPGDDSPSTSRSLTLPEDFRATCLIPGREIVFARVFAFKGSQEGPAESRNSTILCAPSITPTAQVSALPNTGVGGASGSGLGSTLALAVMASVGLVGVGVALAIRVASPGRD